jgi:fibronectin type 3 domain-containing protein
MQSGSPGVLVVWYPPSSSGCSGVTSFRVYRSTSSGTETFLVSVTGYQYQDTSAVAGVRYYYQVSAVNACGEGPRSAEVTAVAR